MNRLFLCGICVFAIAAICPWSTAFAYEPDQSPEGGPERDLQHRNVVIRGDVDLGNSPAAAWTVDLIPLDGGTTQRTGILPDGSFEFRSVTPGQYELRVSDSTGVGTRKAIVVGRNNETFSIGVPEDQPLRWASPDTVSVQQLQHKVPGPALKEFRKADTALKKGRYREAVNYLEAAVAVDPGYADAYNNLGVAYARLEQDEQAAEAFQKAIDLVPNQRGANENLCLLLFKMEHYAEAGQIAGRILRRNSGSAMAHYVVAVSLIEGGGSQNEVLGHLKRAEIAFPNIRLLTAHILGKAGRRADAAKELEAYLRSPESAGSRREVETWLAELRK